MLVAAEEGDWDELERGIRGFQDATQAIRYASVPVVLAPRGLTLAAVPRWRSPRRDASR